MSDRGNDACWASCNVLLVLGILADGERAGHEIITILERQCDRTFAGHEGDLYPLLHRLEERGDIRSRERMNGGRPRRWYRLTRQGTKTLAPYRRRVRRELADHILSRAELLERSTGCPRGQAIERAISAMGDAHSLGLLLRRTRFPLRGLFLTLMTSLIWAAIAACILYLLLHLGLRT